MGLLLLVVLLISGACGDFECQLKIRKATDNQMLQVLLPNVTEDESKTGDENP
jgi:hypothetical protein